MLRMAPASGGGPSGRALGPVLSARWWVAHPSWKYNLMLAMREHCPLIYISIYCWYVK